MPQLHWYVPDKIADTVKRRAQSAGMSTSRYLANLIRRDIGTSGWPEGFFEEVVGGWQGEPLQRPPQGQFEQRETLIIDAAR